VNTRSDVENANRFERSRQRYLQVERMRRDPAAKRIVEALEYLHAGVPKELNDPLADHEGDTLVVAFASPTPRIIETLALGRGRGPQRDDYTHHAAAYVRVRGRVVFLMWWQNGSFDLRTLDVVERKVQNWAAAILQANP
jgi:hypothetical protein